MEDISDLVVHTLLDADRKLQVFGFVQANSKLDEDLILKVLTKCSRDAELQQNVNGKITGRFLVTENYCSYMLRDTLEQLRDCRFDRFQIIEAKLAEVKGVMRENLANMVVNHANVEKLDVTTHVFKDQSKNFMKQAKKKPTSCCVTF